MRPQPPGQHEERLVAVQRVRRGLVARRHRDPPRAQLVRAAARCGVRREADAGEVEGGGLGGSDDRHGELLEE